MRAERVVAGFDSATALLRDLSSHLSGARVPRPGERPGTGQDLLASAGEKANHLPRGLKERIYALSGWTEAVQRHKVGDIRSDRLAEWVAGHYPKQQSDVAFVGSSNGALTHLAAALRAPWLPQTLLLPVRRHGVPPEDASEDLRRMRSTGEELLRANPDWALHHMHDPNQDRLMVAGMCYFRTKWLRLPAAYERHLRDVLRPGGSLVVSDCAMTWPTTRVGERYIFQHGGFGGATTDELQHGSDRVREFLRAYGSDYTKFVAPEPDDESPEAEWGFEPRLLEDLRDLADRQGWNLVRLRYDEPETVSPPVADIHRDWYRDRGLPTGRLLVESFMLMDTYGALRTGSVPFWTVFNKEPSLRALESYLDSREPFDEIRMALFSHGVESVGLAWADQWAGVLARARELGTFLGTDPESFPRDFAVLVRFGRELAQVRGKQPLPSPLRWEEAAPRLDAAEGVELSELMR
ncbi:hypothetical protein [Nocardiopsis kunsanensis]|uniref:hypothetical protein n=1 Tax=Nocardiopsis kunsanensis TaxID=141693 RepID=UPI00034644B5|nr:hypothetical protein [Nocardiopsis kunsanensis]